MSVTTPVDPNRMERQRTVAIDIESIPDPAWVDFKAKDLAAFDMGAHLKKMGRGELNAVAESLGVDPKPFKNMPDLTAEIVRVAAGDNVGDAGWPELVALHEGHAAEQLDGIMNKAVGYRALASRIVAIGVVSYYGDAEDPDPDMTFAVAGEDEAALIASIFDTVAKADVVTGFNIMGYDGPMLRWRALLNGVAVPEALSRMRRYSQRPVCDTMFELGNWDPQPRGTLEEWCWRFGLDAPAKTDWREIVAWSVGQDWDRLKAHVLQDTMAAGALYQAIRPALL